MGETGMAAAIHGITRMVEAGGIAVILIGAIASFLAYARALGRGARAASERESAYRTLRSSLGRSILLGLELLVAADIINTVAVAPSLTGLAVLAGIVAIRTFLSWSLEVEIDGRWPWQGARGQDSREDSPPRG